MRVQKSSVGRRGSRMFGGTFITLMLAVAFLVSIPFRSLAGAPPASAASPSLQQFLRPTHLRVPLEKNKLGHITVLGQVNGRSARFILDTGASATCIDLKSAARLRIPLKPVTGQASGYGGDSEKVMVGHATVRLGEIGARSMEVTAIDLTSVTRAYTAAGAGSIDGVIGDDVLSGRSAIIEYETRSLYLRK